METRLPIGSKIANMDAKPDPSRVLMSEALEGNVSDVESTDQIAGYIVAVIAVSMGEGKIETIVGSTVTFLLDEHYEIEARVLMDDAFNLTQVWPAVKIAGFELHFGEEVYTVKGPLKVSALRIQDIDQQRQMCVLAMKLCRE